MALTTESIPVKVEKVKKKAEEKKVEPKPTGRVPPPRGMKRAYMNK